MAAYKNMHHDVSVTLKFPEPVTLKEATRQAREGMMYWSFYNSSLDGISRFAVSAVSLARITSRRKPGKKTQTSLEMLVEQYRPHAGDVMLYCDKFVRLVGIASDNADLYYVVDELDGNFKPRRNWLSAVGALSPLKGLLEDNIYLYHDKRLADFGCPKKPFVQLHDDGFGIKAVIGKADPMPSLEDRILAIYSGLAREITGDPDHELVSEYRRAAHFVSSEEKKQKLKGFSFYDPANDFVSEPVTLRAVDRNLCDLANQAQEATGDRRARVEARGMDAMRSVGATAEEIEKYIASFVPYRHPRRFDVERREALESTMFHIWYDLDYDSFRKLRGEEDAVEANNMARDLSAIMPYVAEFLRCWISEYPALKAVAIDLAQANGAASAYWLAQALIFANNNQVRNYPECIHLSREGAQHMIEALAMAVVPLKN